MNIRFFITLLIFLSFIACSKNKDLVYENSKKVDPYTLYKEGLESFEKKNYFFASKKFDKAELNFDKPDLASKASIMSSYSLYKINFYKEAENNLNRYFELYRADKNIIYAHYLLALIYYEQIKDERKDLQPLIKAQEKINFFLQNYPNNDYATDLKFKQDLIQNQLAAKELYIAKYYTSVQKWVPAINRLKNIVKLYDKTVFIEEALHRLVEVHYYLGLEEEAKKYAKVLGYNYNSSEWYEQSYKIINRDYKIIKKKNNDKKLKEESLFKKIIDIIN
ncbi:MAG: outer membrane protein assembly factor BamD [Candidatus Pelagibacter bacterium]|nr:outer membrane protein assembly factor BamD [Candidatus Pelagibacter bacterium]MBL6861042.1 outer membrane protein assembly factor BamD [Candidatus Pelagibacter bacterium]